MISLVVIALNEESCVEGAITSALPYVDEFWYLDAGSTDRTVDVMKQYGTGVSLAVDLMRFDFGSAKTLVSRMATMDWILLLDADDRLRGGKHLQDLTEVDEVDAWAFPRYRWADLAQTQQVEQEAFPDFQWRLYRNEPLIHWEGILHEQLVGTTRKRSQNLVVLDHHVDTFHLADPERRAKRAEQRRVLAERAGVKIEGTETAQRLAGV